MFFGALAKRRTNSFRHKKRTSQFVKGVWICDPLRTHAPIVENDQDIGEPDGSVTINIGRAIIGHWLTIVAGAAFGPSAAHRRAV